MKKVLLQNEPTTPGMIVNMLTITIQSPSKEARPDELQ